MYKQIINQSDDQDPNYSTSLFDNKQIITPPQQTPIQDTQTKQPKLEQILHKVQYGDTLQGLSLEYSVPISKIRYRNQLDGDNIYHLKHIIIPDPLIIPMAKDKTEALLIEEFNSYMDYSQKDRKIARYYLSQNNWDMTAARKQYMEDLQWQRKNGKQLNKPQDIFNNNKSIEMKTVYESSELRVKKVN